MFALVAVIATQGWGRSASADRAASARRDTQRKADDKPEGQDARIDALIQKALDLRREGHDKDALTELQKAAAIERLPRVAAQIGLAEQALGLWVAAERDLKEGMDNGNDPWIKKNFAILTNAMEFIVGQLGTFDVWGPPDGAEIFLDGEFVGKVPFPKPLRVAAGNPEMTVKANGFAPTTRPLTIKAGSRVREHVVMRPLSLSLVGSPQPADVTPLTPASHPVASNDAASTGGRWWIWALAAGVVAGAGVGAYLVFRKSDPGCTASATNTCATLSR